MRRAGLTPTGLWAVPWGLVSHVSCVRMSQLRGVANSRLANYWLKTRGRNRMRGDGTLDVDDKWASKRATSKLRRCKCVTKQHEMCCSLPNLVSKSSSAL